jgi:Ca2+-binding RTX toxin-like protein
MRRISLALAIALVALVAAAPASASDAWVSGPTLFYVAAPGETNDLELSTGPGGTTIVDTGAVIVPGAGCTAVSPTEVTCPEGLVSARLRDGDDTGTTLSGHHAILGGPGNDTLTHCSQCSGAFYGNDGDDQLVGGDLSGILDGGAGNDTIEGGAGDERLFGQTGNDLITGGAGADLIAPGPGTDGVDGGADRDTLGYWLARGPMLVDLKSGVAVGAGPDQFDNVESVVGSRFGDDLRGNGLVNRILGGGGPDVLRGRGASDFLFAGGGRDVVYSHDGVLDHVSGGDGFDRAHVDRGLDRVQRVERLF